MRWMSGLPRTTGDGHRIYVHAGLMPGTPIHRQKEQTCLWIRERFLQAKASDFEAHVVHGHTPIWEGKPDPAEPELLEHRTNLDTAAFATGVLSIAVFDAERPGGPIELLQVRGEAVGAHPATRPMRRRRAAAAASAAGSDCVRPTMRRAELGRRARSRGRPGQLADRACGTIEPQVAYPNVGAGAPPAAAARAAAGRDQRARPLGQVSGRACALPTSVSPTSPTGSPLPAPRCAPT